MIVNAWGAERLGGAERQLNSLCPLLIERGVRPVVIARERSRRPRATNDPFEVVYVRVPPIPGLDRVVFVLGALWALARARPDVVHAFGAFSQSTSARLYRRLTGTPFVTKILRSGELGDLYRLRRKRFGRRRSERLFRDADAFVVISREIDDELAAAGVEPERRLRIPNGVDIERFYPAADSELGDRLRDEFGRDGPIVVAVGRMTPEKRMPELSALWHLVRHEHPGATLVIYGKLVNRIDPETVRLHDDPGVVNPGARADIEYGYRAADLYVSASAAEGLSNALLEAMASGLACVVTDVGGVRDVVDDTVNGVIVDSDDLGALVSAINRLLGDPEARSTLGGRARETVAARFGLDAVADSLTAEYRRLAAVRSPG